MRPAGFLLLAALALALAGCTVTGVAAPSGEAAHTGDSATQYMGEPGYNAP